LGYLDKSGWKPRNYETKIALKNTRQGFKLHDGGFAMETKVISCVTEGIPEMKDWQFEWHVEEVVAKLLEARY